MDAILLNWSVILVTMAGVMGALLIWARARRCRIATAREARVRVHPHTAHLLSAALSAEQHTILNPTRRNKRLSEWD